MEYFHETECTYVPTKLNPADISTRKAKLDKIIKKLWWNGPEFLLDVVEKCLSQEFRLNTFGQSIE